MVVAVLVVCHRFVEKTQNNTRAAIYPFIGRYLGANFNFEAAETSYILAKYKIVLFMHDNLVSLFGLIHTSTVCMFGCEQSKEPKQGANLKLTR